MVLLFVIASLQGMTPHPLFYRYYDEVCSNLVDSDNENEQNLEKQVGCLSVNQTRRQQVARVVEVLHSHSLFHTDTNKSKTLKSKEIDHPSFLDSDDGQEDIEVCSFRLNKLDPFPIDMRVIWLSVNGFGVALVCYHFENRLIAEMILKLLTRQLMDFCRFLHQPSEIFIKPDKVQVVLNKFLPYGQLLFMNHRLIRQLERETETAMKGVLN